MMHGSSLPSRPVSAGSPRPCSVTVEELGKHISLNQPQLISVQPLAAVLRLAGLNIKLKLMPADACDSCRLIVVVCCIQTRRPFGL